MGGSNGNDPLRFSNGRPRLLTEQVRKRIVELVEQGNHVYTASRACGVSPGTIRRWKRRFAAGDPEARDTETFWMDIKRAQAIAEAKFLGQIHVAATDGTWQAAAWILERRYPHHWAKKDVIEVRGARRPEDLSDQELAEVSRRARRRR